MLDSPNLDERREQRYRHILRKLCNSCGILPASHTLPEGVEMLDAHMSGGFADVWIGRYKGRQVAVKTLRAFNANAVGKVQKVSQSQALYIKTLLKALSAF